MSTTVEYLRDAERALLRARGSVNSAKAELFGARASRCQQLVDQLENSLCWLQRITLFVESDEANRQKTAP